MDFARYQQNASRTDHTGDDPGTAILISLLGLSGEAGTLATAYKKVLRDGPAYLLYKEHLIEEMGDTLWYLATLANKLGVQLDEVATKNLRKTKSRWTPTGTASASLRFLDDKFPRHEQLPRRFEIRFRQRTTKGSVKLFLSRDGRRCGDPLTDNAYFEDGYRFHDVFHLGYAAVLGWSPVTRKLLNCKRRSDKNTDEIQDGGRAGVIEEGIAALVFNYATNHAMLDGVTSIDFELLKLIRSMTSHLEVFEATWRDWELAILEGYKIFRILVRERGGIVIVDLRKRSLGYRRA